MKQIETTADLDRGKYWDYVTTKHSSDAYAICGDLQRLDKLLKTILDIRQFIPMDEERGVLEPVLKMDYGIETVPGYPIKYPTECYEEDLRKYKEAQEKILFKYDFIENDYAFLFDKFVYNKEYKCFYQWGKKANLTIQDLIKLNIPVTEALRQKLK